MGITSCKDLNNADFNDEIKVVDHQIHVTFSIIPLNIFGNNN